MANADSPADLPPVELPGGRVVPEHALIERASTSGGPGGQHANKASTRIDLGVVVASMPLRPHEVVLVRERLGGRISGDGILKLSVASHRSQLRNRIEARRRMTALLRDALHEDPDRRPTRPSRGATQRWRNARERDQAQRRSRRWRPGTDDE